MSGLTRSDELRCHLVAFSFKLREKNVGQETQTVICLTFTLASNSFETEINLPFDNGFILFTSFSQDFLSIML